MSDGARVGSADGFKGMGEGSSPPACPAVFLSSNCGILTLMCARYRDLQSSAPLKHPPTPHPPPGATAFLGELSSLQHKKHVSIHITLEQLFVLSSDVIQTVLKRHWRHVRWYQTTGCLLLTNIKSASAKMSQLQICFTPPII